MRRGHARWVTLVAVMAVSVGVAGMTNSYRPASLMTHVFWIPPRDGISITTLSSSSSGDGFDSIECVVLCVSVAGSRKTLMSSHPFRLIPDACGAIGRRRESLPRRSCGIERRTQNGWLVTSAFPKQLADVSPRSEKATSHQRLADQRRSTAPPAAPAVVDTARGRLCRSVTFVVSQAWNTSQAHTHANTLLPRRAYSQKRAGVLGQGVNTTS